MHVGDAALCSPVSPSWRTAALQPAKLRRASHGAVFISPRMGFGRGAESRGSIWHSPFPAPCLSSPTCGMKQRLLRMPFSFPSVGTGDKHLGFYLCSTLCSPAPGCSPGGAAPTPCISLSALCFFLFHHQRGSRHAWSGQIPFATLPKARFLLKEGDAQEKITLFPPSRKLMFLRFLPQPLLPPSRTPSPHWGRAMEQFGGVGMQGIEQTSLEKAKRRSKQSSQAWH